MAGTTLEEVLQAQKDSRTAMQALVQAGQNDDKDAKRKAIKEYVKLLRRQRELEQKYIAENPPGTTGV